MEWLDWGSIWAVIKAVLAFGIGVFWVWIGVAVAFFPFLTVQIWKLNNRLDALGVFDSIVAKVESEPPLPPRTYAQNMADHEQATKRLSEGLEP